MTTFDTGTVLAVSVARGSTSSGSFVAQTWSVYFVEPVQFTSFVADIFAADTYSFKIDGVTVATATASTAQTGVTFTPGSPVVLAAGSHTFQLVGTAARRYYYNSSASPAITGTGQLAAQSWSTWSESAGNTVPGAINFNPPVGYTIADVFPDNSSSSTTWAAQTWGITFSSATALESMWWWAKDADTYTLTVDGVTVATATASGAGQIEFRPASAFTVASGTRTFKVQGTAARRFYYTSTGSPTVSGNAPITAWGTFQEFNTGHCPGGRLVFTGDGSTSASGAASLSLSASGGAKGRAAGSGSLSLSASGSGKAAAGGSASLTFDATGGTVAPEPAAGSASLALSAAGGASASPAGTASLSLSAVGTALAVIAASGSASLSLSASGSAVMSSGGTATLTLSAGGVALVLYETDLSNAFDGLDLLLTATVTFAVPVAATPPGLVAAERYDKAVAYPVPVMVDGRPT